MKAIGFALILIATGLAVPSITQDVPSHRFSAGLHESHLRKTVIEKVMPTYPEEALRKGTSGLVRLKLEIGLDGKVLRIKVNPKTPTLLSKAAAEAARKWQFKPFPDRSGLGRPSMGRLTFDFVITKGVGVASLYDPGPNAPDTEHLGYFNSAKEFKEWELWEEVIDMAAP